MKKHLNITDQVFCGTIKLGAYKKLLLGDFFLRCFVLVDKVCQHMTRFHQVGVIFWYDFFVCLFWWCIFVFIATMLAGRVIFSTPMLFAIAFEMIFEKRNERKEKTSDAAITKDHIHNLAVFPLAIPLIAGPGAISATVLISGTMDGWIGKLQLVAVIGRGGRGQRASARRGTQDGHRGAGLRWPWRTARARTGAAGGSGRSMPR